MLGEGFVPESSPPRGRFPSRRGSAMGPASSAGVTRATAWRASRCDRGRERRRGWFFTSAAGNFRKTLNNKAMVDNYGRFDKEFDMAGTVGAVGLRGFNVLRVKDLRRD